MYNLSYIFFGRLIIFLIKSDLSTFSEGSKGELKKPKQY